MSDPRTAGARGRSLALASILVVSGAASLLHESAWFRLLVPSLGAGALPAAVVAAGALVGLGVGSALGGRLADRVRRPGLLLSLAEISAAALGLVVPAALEAAGALRGEAGLALATAVLALAALPWGLSLPAAVAIVAPPPGGVGRAFARLYAWNTAGGVVGVSLGAALLFEALGNRATIRAASFLEGAAGLAAAALALRTASPTVAGLRPAPSVGASPTLDETSGGAAASAVASVPPGPLRAGAGPALAAALAGAAGVGAQVAWGRRLTPILGATFPVFASVLAIHLIAIALGTALLGPRGDRRAGTRRRGPLGTFGILAIAAALVTAGTAFALGPVVEAVRASWWEAYGNPFAMLGLRAAAAAALVLPGVLLGAALLPWLVRAAAAGEGRAVRTTGRLLCANTVGAAAGGLVVALWGIPAVGTAGVLVLCAAALLLAGASGLAGRSRAGLGLAGAIVAALPFVAPIPDVAGTSVVGALYSPTAYRPDDVVTLLARDGRTASVLVRDRDGRLEYWVEGSLESSTGPTDRLHLGLLGHLPVVLHNARGLHPPRVALVGLGGGFTAQAVVQFLPWRLDVYELEPEVAAAAALFAAEGGGLPSYARLHVADGRRGILDGSEPLDVISSDPVHPSVAGSAYLYTVEWWRAASARLSPEGILCQWLPLYQMHVDEVRLVLRTFAASVPYPYVFLVGGDALLVGSRTPIRLDAALLANAMTVQGAASLRAWGLATPGRLLGLLALDPDGCRAVAGPGELNTDDRLLLELRCGWREGNDPAAAYALLTSHPADPRTLLSGPLDAAFEADLERARELRTALGAWVAWDAEEAYRRFGRLAALEPGNLLASRLRDEAEIEVARGLLRAGRSEEAAGLARSTASRAGVETILRLDAAELLVRAGAVEEGKAIAAPYAAAHPWPRARRLAVGRLR